MVSKNKLIHRFKKLFALSNKYIPRIIINKELAFSEDGFNSRINKLSKTTMKKIETNFSEIVKEVISLSAYNNEIYLECLGTAGEHFVTTLKMRRK